MPGSHVNTFHPRVTPPPERFWTKVEFTDTCWLWLGSVNPQGYGTFWHSEQRPNVRVHRWAYEFCIGFIPDGLQIDHLCRVRLCVNLDHIEAVTQRVNILRGNGAAAREARKTHCKYGHEFNAENTIYRKNRHRIRRTCRACIKNAKALPPGVVPWRS